MPEVELAPEPILGLVVPPLLYSAAIQFSFFTFVRHLRPILGLGIGGLVVITTLAAGTTASWPLPSLGLGSAPVLAVVVSLPDTVTAVAHGRAMGLPRRVINILGAGCYRRPRRVRGGQRPRAPLAGAEEVARAALFLACDDFSCTTGPDLAVDARPSGVRSTGCVVPGRAVRPGPGVGLLSDLTEAWQVHPILGGGVPSAAGWRSFGGGAPLVGPPRGCGAKGDKNAALVHFFA
ncbi:hypothetical protein [Streptomyces sp. NPDC127072]|uniref:hypothetical protein n=1 Tax=Streptomyces sp. NPDC127072 TaxID=3347129 RepID=UPI00366939E6